MKITERLGLLKLAKRNWTMLLVVGILLISLVATVFLVQRQQQMRGKAAGASVTLAMSSAVNSTNHAMVGTPFTVNVSIGNQTDAYEISAANVVVTYDSNLLDLGTNPVALGSFFPFPSGTEMLNKVDTATAGRVSFALGAACPTVIPAPTPVNGQTPCSTNRGSGILATLNFVPKAAGTANVAIIADSGNTAIAAVGQTATVLTSTAVSPLSLPIDPAPVTTPTLSFSVTVQEAITIPTTPRGTMAANLTLLNPTTGAVVGSPFSITMSQNRTSGLYETTSPVVLTGITPGSYRVMLDGVGHLKKELTKVNGVSTPVNLVGGSNTPDWKAQQLFGGDAIKDTANTVNALDFGKLAGDFLNSATQGTSTADFNFDGRVDALDFGALAGNFLKAGD